MNSKLKTQSSKPQPKSQKLTTADKKILTELKRAKNEINARIDKYEFGQALHKIYDFFWHEFCDKYLETAKSQIPNPKSQKITKEILLYTLSESLKLLHPFMPFVTEEIWSYLLLKDKKLLLVEGWTKQK